MIKDVSPNERAILPYALQALALVLPYQARFSVPNNTYPHSDVPIFPE
jgi:hypothetical protein